MNALTMNNSNTAGKKALLAAVALAAALSAATVAARPTPPPPGPISNTLMTVVNHTDGCIRLYFNGNQYDYAKGREGSVAAQVGQSYLVSIFPGNACGGKAKRTVKFTFPNTSAATFDVN